jgi:hypothetical protein
LNSYSVLKLLGHHVRAFISISLISERTDIRQELYGLDFRPFWNK